MLFFQIYSFLSGFPIFRFFYIQYFKIRSPVNIYTHTPTGWWLHLLSNINRAIINILRLLSLPIHKHNIFIYLYSSYISLNNFVRMCMCVDVLQCYIYVILCITLWMVLFVTFLFCIYCFHVDKQLVFAYQFCSMLNSFINCRSLSKDS